MNKFLPVDELVEREAHLWDHYANIQLHQVLAYFEVILLDYADLL